LITQPARFGLGVLLFVTAAAFAARAATPGKAAPPAAEAKPAAAASQGPVIAQVGGVTVTLDQLQRPLFEGYGLNILLNLVQLEVAKENAAKAGVKVTPADIAKETELTIDRMFEQSNARLVDKMNVARDKGDQAGAAKIAEQIKKENAQAFEQFLQNQRITRSEFDIVTETNAYLRKIAEPMLAGKISEDNLKDAFRSLYGENVKCRHIQCSNLKEINEAKSRLEKGEPFAKVAQEMSRNAGTARLGGELPPFSINTQGLPEPFKQAAFALKEGEISDVVQAEGGFHLILLEKRIPPKAVKFEDVKASLRKDLEARAVDATVKQLRQQLGNQAVKDLVINDPILKKQWQEKLEKRDATIKDREEIRKQLQLERERAATQPAEPAPDLGTTPPQRDLAPGVPQRDTAPAPQPDLAPPK
jgi:foldase protein PrsA